MRSAMWAVVMGTAMACGGTTQASDFSNLFHRPAPRYYVNNNVYQTPVAPAPVTAYYPQANYGYGGGRDNCHQNRGSGNGGGWNSGYRGGNGPGYGGGYGPGYGAGYGGGYAPSYGYGAPQVVVPGNSVYGSYSPYGSSVAFRLGF